MGLSLKDYLCHPVRFGWHIYLSKLICAKGPARQTAPLPQDTVFTPSFPDSTRDSPNDGFVAM